jgi:hypothetical protein
MRGRAAFSVKPLDEVFSPTPSCFFKVQSPAVSTALTLDVNEVEAHRILAEIAIEMKDNALACTPRSESC